MIPKEQLEFKNFDQVQRWQDIAQTLLQKYCVRFYKVSKEEWEAPHREYSVLDPSDPNFIAEYKILIDKSQQQIINQLKSIKVQIENGEMPKADRSFGQAGALIFDCHLYQPLLYAENDAIRVQPVALNKGEKNFVEDLRRFYQDNPSYFADKELYLLRNKGKGGGVGFFEAGNFYPDFVLWMLDGEKQYVSFVDPKGIFNLEAHDPKIAFYKTVDENLGNKNVILNSFIASVTPYHLVKKWDGGMSEDDFASKHILFQEADPSTGYIKRLFSLISGSIMKQ